LTTKQAGFDSSTDQGGGKRRDLLLLTRVRRLFPEQPQPRQPDQDDNGDNSKHGGYRTRGVGVGIATRDLQQTIKLDFMG
jgi:hypothetical protein